MEASILLSPMPTSLKRIFYRSTKITRKDAYDVFMAYTSTLQPLQDTQIDLYTHKMIYGTALKCANEVFP